MVKFFALALALACALAVVVVGTGSAITGPKVIRAVSIGGVDVNLDSKGEPKAGDRFYSTSALHSWAGTKRGNRVGREEVFCTFTAVHFERGWASVFCTAQWFLPGGSVSAQAFLRFTDGPQKITVPVTGGTGVYVNASGWVAIRDIGSGESGNSDLAFHLQP
jgi:hypothetical protein